MLSTIQLSRRGMTRQGLWLPYDIRADETSIGRAEFGPTVEEGEITLRDQAYACSLLSPDMKDPTGFSALWKSNDKAKIYVMRRGDAVLHFAAAPGRQELFEIDKGGARPLVVKRTKSWNPFRNAKASWDVLGAGGTPEIGRIARQSMFNSLTLFELPAEVGEPLQLFLFWVMINDFWQRAQKDGSPN